MPLWESAKSLFLFFFYYFFYFFLLVLVLEIYIYICNVNFFFDFTKKVEELFKSKVNFYLLGGFGELCTLLSLF